MSIFNKDDRCLSLSVIAIWDRGEVKQGLAFELVVLSVG